MNKNGKTQKGFMYLCVGKWFFELEKVLAKGNFPSISYLISERL